MSKDEGLRKSGIPYVADLPWGAHICGFHETIEELINVAVPYFQAGLENNEYCIWIVAEPLSLEEATAALKDRIKAFETYESQIEIIDYSEWYFENDDFKAEKTLAQWTNRLNKAEQEGYDGIRLCGCTSWLINRHWRAFMEYKALVEKIFATSKVIVLCPFQLSQFSNYEILNTIRTYHFAFLMSSYDWKYSDYIVNYNRVNLIEKMASSFVHEIRNPLTAVRGFIQLLQGKQELQNYNKYFSLILEELDRTNDIISEFLSLAKEKRANIGQHNLNDLVTGILPLLQAEAVQGSKNIILNTQPVQDIMIDPKDLRQVILNFVRNSLESMAAGGTLTINTYMNELANRVILEIQDTGHGIPQEIINKLGTPFLTTKDSGTGLGLFVCYQILEKYQAKVDVSSSPQGTCFTISFPCAQVSEGQKMAAK